MKKIFKKTVIFICTILLAGGIFHSVAIAAIWTGSGTSASPYRITNESGLKLLATNVNNGNSYSGKHFLLAADIALTDIWTPIGTSSTAFRGTFNGNGKTISGMTVTTDSHAGLFAYIGSGAAIKNVNMTDFNIVASSYISALVGEANSGTGTITISNCNVDGTLTDNEDSYYNGYLAGIVGYANAENGSLIISDCVSNGDYNCNSFSGGIVGYGKGDSHSLKLFNCTNNAYIDTKNNSSNCGGIAGYLSSAELTSCANFGSVYGNAYSEDNGSSWLGGITGDGAGVIFNGCANYGNVSTFFAGGITGSQHGNHIADNCLNVGKLTHSSDGYGYSIIHSGFAVNSYYLFGKGIAGTNYVSATELASGSVAHSLRKYFGQKIGVDKWPVPLTSDNRVYKVTVAGEVNATYYVNSGSTIDFPELSSCAAYFDGDSKFDTSSEIVRDYALAAKGYHKYEDGICVYCGNEGVSYTDVGSCGESVIWKLSPDGVLTVSGTGAMTNYSVSNPAPWSEYASDIKSVIINNGITSVGDYAFKGLTNVTELYIDETVTVIGKYAFSGMTGLTDIAIENNITEIGEYAFASCTGITDLSLSKRLKTIGDYAFYQCENLDYVSVPSNVTSLGNGAFMNCSNLISIYLYDGLENIGSYALSGTGISELDIPKTVVKIGEYAFKNCSDLEEVSFLGAAPEIATTSFYGDTAFCLTPAYDSGWDSTINKNYGGNLTWAIGRGTCGNSVNWIVDYSRTLTISGTGQMRDFSVDYSGISTAPWSHIGEQILSLVINNGVTYIGNYAFKGCSNMKSVSIADSVTKIGYDGGYSSSNCFDGCNSLTQITIPSKVTFISKTTFHGCPNLTTINVESGNTAYSGVDGILYSRYKNTIYCYPAGKTDTSFTIPDSVNTIAPYAFSRCNNLKEVTIPSSITTIEEDAFCSCKNLNRITFSGSAPDSIKSYAFWSITADVYFPISDTSWTSSIMKDYGGDLTWHAGEGTCGTGVQWKIVYVDGYADLTISGSGAMNNYTSDTMPWKNHLSSIKTLTVSNGVTSVGEYALYSGKSLAKVTLADSVKSIGNNAFYNCSALYNLTLGNGIQTIGDSAFMSTAMSSINFPDSLKTVGEYSFYNCTKLQSLNFGSGMKTIGYTAFANCTALKTVDLGSSITTLNQSSFNGCSSLTKIVIPASVTSVGTYAFRNCKNLQYVEFSGNAPTINTDAFSGITCNAYYLSSKSGWTSSKLVNYGGTLTWGAVSQRGTCGTNAEWILDTAGNLYICGSGYMSSYSETSGAPWYDYRTNIKKVALRGVTSIGAYAFDDCSALETVSVPSTVSSIGKYAFADCTELQVVMFDGSAPGFGNDSFYGVSCEMWYPNTASNWTSSVRKDYGGTLTWRSTTTKGSCGTNTIWALDTAKTLVILGSGAMTDFASYSHQPWASSSTEIKSVIIGGKVTTVGKYAFRKCTAIETVTIGESIISVNYLAFSDCSSLNTITFLGEAPSITSEAFSKVTATAYYPLVNNSWTSSKKQNYGGTLTWESVCMNHKKTVAPATEPTCTASGLTEGLYCSLCNEVLVAQEVIPANGHYIMGSDNTQIPADTLEGDCVKEYICTVCNGVAKEALGHRVLGTVPVEADPLTITNNSTYPFSLKNGTYYSTNKLNNSYSELKITAKYDCILTLNYGVSSEEDYDKFYIHHNGSSKDKISGEISDRSITLTLVAGDSVTVSYDKDESYGSGSDCGWVTLIYDPVMVDGIGDVPADTVEPSCTDAVVCRYCQTVVKEAVGHRVILQLPEPECPFETVNASEIPFVLTDGIYYSNNHTGSSVSDLTINVKTDCTLTFNYGVSSEPSFDKLIILLNNTTKNTISGIVSDQVLTLDLVADDVVTIRYQKDSSVNKNDDMGWVSIQYDNEPVQEIVQADTVEPGCNGVICDFCQTVVKEAPGHNWDEGVETVSATETSEGEMLYTCKRCGETKTEVIPVLEHTHNHKSVVTAPTCTEKGYTTYTCECGDTYVADYVDENGHDYKSEITTPATHLAEGVKTFTCNCGDTYTETIDKIAAHNHKSVVTAPTCTEKGYTTYTCECGDTYVADYVDENGHDWDETQNEDNLTRPTATKKGYYTYTCKTDSSHTITEEIESADYTEFDEAYGTITAYLNNPDITEEAKNEIISAIQSYAANNPYLDSNGNIRRDLIESEQNIVIEATAFSTEIIADVEEKLSNCESGNHIVLNYSPITEATCKDPGKKKGNCYYCGEEIVTDNEDAPALGHDIVIDAAVAPDCSNEGLTEGSHCSRCDDITVAQETIPETGHTYSKKVTTPATHTSTGVMTYSCVCGDSYTETIGILEDHSYNATTTAPTCTEKGYTTYTCVCGDTYVADYVDATGHSDTDNDGNCDNCNEHLCDHACHKSGFAGFFWKIICFFSKLFGSNKVCECGNTHY